MSGYNVGFVIFPSSTQLDLTAPFEVSRCPATPPAISVPTKFARTPTHIVAKTMQPVSSNEACST
jgi:cyclohexyl-isocyanide hydratase